MPTSNSYFGIYVRSTRGSYDKLKAVLNDHLSFQAKADIQIIENTYFENTEPFCFLNDKDERDWEKSGAAFNFMFGVLDIICRDLNLNGKNVRCFSYEPETFVIGVKQYIYDNSGEPKFSVKGRAKVIDLFAENYQLVVHNGCARANTAHI